MQRLNKRIPLVSVIIPSYNHATYLDTRIHSVLSQTFTDFELIILDDASTDNSREIINKHASEDDRISFYPSNSNSGSPFVQWNRGVNIAKADLVWIAESDDVASPDFLQKMVEVHFVYPAIALAYSQSNRMDDSGKITGTWRTFTDPFDQDLFNSDFVRNGIQFIHDFLIHKNVIPNASAVVFKKEAYRQVQGADESLRTNSDWLTWVKMLLHRDVAFVAAPLNNFRYHAGSVIAQIEICDTNGYKEQYDLTMRKAFEAYCNTFHTAVPADLLKINKKYLAFDYGNKGAYEIEKGNYLSGFAHLLHASLFPKPTLGYLRRYIKRNP